MSVKVLDCTLRDGGLGLEDAEKNGISDTRFEAGDARRVAELLAGAGIDIVELGSIELTPDDRRGFRIYRSIEEISETMPRKGAPGQMFAALYRGPDTPLGDIPEWGPSLCEAVRVIIRYSELEKSVEFCAALAGKGYKVFVQPMLTMRYSEEEIDYLIDSCNRMGAYALYFVDSYGYMGRPDVRRLFEKYDEGLKEGIRIGFHAHNNMNLAYSNVLEFLGCAGGRDVIVDSCIMGMGQGAGNLQTELLVGDGGGGRIEPRYRFGDILDACELIGRYTQEGPWGYSVTRLLPALRRTAYKFAIALRAGYGMTYSEIDRVLSGMPDHMRHRYTKESLAALLAEGADGAGAGNA